MKQCLKCNKTKNDDCYVVQSKASDGLFPWCKECHKEYRKSKYNEDKRKSLNYTNSKRKLRIKWLQELKSNTPCTDCKEIYDPWCMDFDHIASLGEKVSGVSRMVLENRSKDSILEEIKKCELVCLLCHNRRTNNRLNDTLGSTRKYGLHEQRNIDVINKFKNNQCSICSKQYETFNMQCDHINPSEKLFDISALKSRKLETLELELAKCQVLCALCHRQKSINEQKYNKYSSDRPKFVKKKELHFDPITDTKECGKCNLMKHRSLFRLNKNTISKMDTYCKECFNVYRKENRRKKKM